MTMISEAGTSNVVLPIGVFSEEKGYKHADEKFFHCPCHGFRFNANRQLINGPTISDLQKTEIES